MTAVALHHIGRRTHRTATSAIVASSLVVVAACGGGSNGEGSANRAVDPNGGGTRVAFDSANFVDPMLDTNPYHPLKPGLQWVRGGTTEVGSRVVPHEAITTMTDVIRVIDGVPTIAMLDESTDSGEVAQVGMDYLALDSEGNVWILGGYTEDYEGGEFTNAETAWLGQGDGQEIGILSPAAVDMTTPRWTPRGVGVINNVPLDASLHQDTFELYNFIEVSPEGLAEASQTVLDLEAHAVQTAPDVYAAAPPAQRAGS